MNNENFEKSLYDLSFLEGDASFQKKQNYNDRVIYSIISNSSILNDYYHDFKDFNFDHYPDCSLAYFFCGLTKEAFKISVSIKEDHNHNINGVKINLLDGTTISIWFGIDEYWGEI